MKKTYIIAGIIVAVGIITIICIIICNKNFINNNYKNTKKGNNKSIQEIEDYILKIDEYKANIEIKVINNRNENIYKANQTVTKDYEKQVMLEPNEIKGLEMNYANNKLEIKNTQLNLSKIYENYSNLSNNNLFLTEFIKSYKEGSEKTVKKIETNMILFEVKTNRNKYDATQKLYVNKQNLQPEKLEILDDNNNEKVYILYNEIEINI